MTAMEDCKRSLNERRNEDNETIKRREKVFLTGLIGREEEENERRETSEQADNKHDELEKRD